MDESIDQGEETQVKDSNVVSHTNCITPCRAVLCCISNPVKRFISSFTIDRDSPLYVIWLWIISIAILYNLILIPFRASFFDANVKNLIAFMVLDYACADIIYLVDMFIRARTTYFYQGIIVQEPRALFLAYFRSWQFVYDVVSILPTDFLYIITGPAYAVVRTNRMIRLARFFEMTSRVESVAAFPNVFRMATTVLGILIALHYTAIFYHSYSKTYGFGIGDDEMTFFQLSLERAQISAFSRYTYCLYWATMTLCFIGEMPPGVDPHQKIIQCAIWLLGLTMFGAIVGRTGLILTNVDAASNIFNRQVDTVRTYLKLQRISPSLFDKVMLWFNYAFENRVIGGEEKVLKPLPNKMKAELACDIHLATLKRIQLFADMDDSVLVDLVTTFHLEIYSPNDYVCKKGDIGKHMYVVKRGVLEVVSEDGGQVFASLGAGSVFGEISLLKIPGSITGNRRTANVRSKGFSDLFSLSKDDLYTCLQDHPGAMKKLINKGLEILRKENKIKQESITNKAEAEKLLYSRLTNIESDLDETETRLARLMADMAISRKSALRRINLLEKTLHIEPSAKQAEKKTPAVILPVAGVLHQGSGGFPSVQLLTASPIPSH